MTTTTTTTTTIKVAILEDHQSIIDGYLYRLSADPKIKVVATFFFGEELESTLAQHHVDVLLLDVQIPVSASNSNIYPVLHAINKILQDHPNLNILVISMHTQAVLVQSLIEAGVSGYIFKDDFTSIQQLAKIVTMIARGGVYFSESAYQLLRQGRSGKTGPFLSPRQIEALLLCTSYPDDSTAELAERLGVASSTLRNLLSTAYIRLGVHTRAAAITKIKKLGLTPDIGVTV